MPVGATKVFEVPQDTSGKYTALIVDENKKGLPASSIQTATLSLYDAADHSVFINSREDQDILNTNDVTIDTAGNLVWLFRPEDMPRLHDPRTPEVHVALFTIDWDAGAKQILHEVRFRILAITIV